MKKWLLLAPLFALVIFVVVRAAWMADDAYITFRACDNWLRGYGPVWNTYERAQAFTNPLWMIAVTALVGITRELYVSVNVFEIALAALLALVVARGARTTAGAVVALTLLALSRAFADFAASGMENALAHVLCALWVLAAVRRSRSEPLFMGLLLTTRLDFLWLVLPRASLLALRAPRRLALGLAPVIAWELFAFVYYGSFLPTSARAKLTSGIPRLALLSSGVDYFLDSIKLDPLTLAVLAVAIALGARRQRAVALGLALALAYVLFVGGDFMSGRFFSAPFVAAVTLLAATRLRARGALALGASAASLAALAGFPTLTDRFQKIPDLTAPIIDCRLVFHPFTGFTEARAGGPGLFPPFIAFSEGLRQAPGALVLPAIGIAGYHAGPRVRIIDSYALSDPLRARLPIPDAKNEANRKMGHFLRPVPEGYRETVESGINRIEDPSLRAYYAVVQRVTQGPVFDLERVALSVKLELGLYDASLEPYLARYSEKPVEIAWLPPSGAPPPLPFGPEAVGGKGMLPCYSWWRPCAARGYAFTETGLRVTFPLPTSAPSFTARISPGDYELVYRRRGAELARESVTFQGGAQSHTIPAQPFDAIILLPRARGIREVDLFVVR